MSGARREMNDDSATGRPRDLGSSGADGSARVAPARRALLLTLRMLPLAVVAATLGWGFCMDSSSTGVELSPVSVAGELHLQLTGPPGWTFVVNASEGVGPYRFPSTEPPVFYTSFPHESGDVPSRILSAGELPVDGRLDLGSLQQLESIVTIPRGESRLLQAYAARLDGSRLDVRPSQPAAVRKNERGIYEWESARAYLWQTRRGAFAAAAGLALCVLLAGLVPGTARRPLATICIVIAALASLVAGAVTSRRWIMSPGSAQRPLQDRIRDAYGSGVFELWSSIGPDSTDRILALQSTRSGEHAFLALNLLLPHAAIERTTLPPANLDAFAWIATDGAFAPPAGFIRIENTGPLQLWKREAPR
jgi:hypothetical protein